MALPSSITLDRKPGMVRFIMPVRLRSGSRAVGFIPIAFGLVFMGYAVLVILSSLNFGFGDAPQGSNFPEDAAAIEGPEAPTPPPPAPVVHFGFQNILGALFGLPFLVVGLVPVGIGIVSFFPSHAEVLLTESEVVALERMGPVPIRQRRLIAQITKLRIGTSSEKSQALHNYGIFVQTDDPAKELRVSQRYSLEMITPLAQALVGELHGRGKTNLVVENFIPPAPEAAPSLPAPEPAVPQPAESKIACVATDDSITLVVPRTGLKGAAKALMTFALFWNGLSVPFFIVVLVQFIGEPSLENLGIVGFLSIFVTIGTAFFLAGIQTAFRKAVLLATRESLVFTQTGPIRKKELQWTRDELAAVRCTNSNTSVNGRVLMQLTVTTRGQAARVNAMFVGRDEAELQWMASLLHDFYGLPRPTTR